MLHLSTYCTQLCYLTFHKYRESGWWNLKFHNLGQFHPNYPFVSLGAFLGKNDCYFLLTFFILSCSLTFQKDHKSRSWYWRLQASGQSGLNCSFPSKGDFSGKLSTITFVYLVSPITLQHFKQILRAVD